MKLVFYRRNQGVTYRTAKALHVQDHDLQESPKKEGKTDNKECCASHGFNNFCKMRAFRQIDQIRMADTHEKTQFAYQPRQFFGYLVYPLPPQKQTLPVDALMLLLMQRALGQL